MDQGLRIVLARMMVCGCIIKCIVIRDALRMPRTELEMRMAMAMATAMISTDHDRDHYHNHDHDHDRDHEKTIQHNPDP